MSVWHETQLENIRDVIFEVTENFGETPELLELDNKIRRILQETDSRDEPTVETIKRLEAGRADLEEVKENFLKESSAEQNRILSSINEAITAFKETIGELRLLIEESKILDSKTSQMTLKKVRKFLKEEFDFEGEVILLPSVVSSQSGGSWSVRAFADKGDTEWAEAFARKNKLNGLTMIPIDRYMLNFRKA